MKYQVQFDSDSTCLFLIENYADGHRRYTVYDSVSEVVSWLRDKGIEAEII